jgi:hypothetical protein
MNEQRLESALSAIRLSDIATPIVTDDVLASITQRKRRVPWVLLILGLPLALGLWLLLYRTHEQSRPLKGTSNPQNEVAAPNPAPKSHSTESQKHDVVHREISKPSSEVDMVHHVYRHIQFSKIAQNEAGELAARVEIELTNDELLRVGIAIDSGAVYKVGGSTVILDSTGLRLKDVHVTQVDDTENLWVVTPLRLYNQRYLRHEDDEQIFDEPWNSYPNPVAENSEIQSTFAVAHCKSVFSTIVFDDSKNLPDAAVEYPRVRNLVSQIGVALGMQATCVDSMLVFEFADQGIRLPVDRLLVPIKYSTPWIANPNVEGELRRVVGVSWYIPTQELFARLPERVRNFIQPEYEATIRFVEEQLSRDQLCNLLAKPSALGLCTTVDNRLSIDGVGPIPARHAVTISVRSQQPTIADISIVTDLGQTLLLERGVALPGGLHKVNLQISGRNIPSGAYNVVVTSTLGTATSRILVE